MVWAQPHEYDERLGQEAALQVERTLGLYEDEALNRYVDEVGQRLIAALNHTYFDYEFAIIDDPTPNAFALPGGYIYVTRGLLALVQSVDELACVLSHEVIHVDERHSVKQMKRSILPALLQVPGLLVGAVAGEKAGSIVSAPFDLGSSFFTSTYSRKHETQADQMGVALAAKAGFDPNALSPMLDRIMKWEETRTEQEEKKNYFSTHPYTPDRIKKLKPAISELTWSLNSLHEEPVLPLLDGLVFGENPAKGVFVDSVFLHADIDFSVVFPSDWIYINQHDAVGAMNSDKTALVYLTLEDTTQSPEQWGIDFVKRVKRTGELKASAEKVEVNAREAFLVSVVQHGEGEDIYAHFIWIEMGDHVYRITAIKAGGFKEQLKRTALSLHPLTESEKQMIEVEQLYLTNVEEDGSWEALAERTESTLEPKYLRVLNGSRSHSAPPSGERVKVVKSYPYVPEDSSDQ
ncbi:hypothetical protein BFP72_17505 [Reichenbachiella sp. 5M10]|nr:hypothetical protein BFP72_17505 [Reichenbachiella sp. 5M10]